MNTEVQQLTRNFFEKNKYKKFAKGEILINSDQDPAYIYYLSNGIVKMYTISENGNELILNTFKPGAFFPMSWAISDIKNYYYFEAQTDLEVYLAPRDTTLNFLHTHPQVLFHLLQRVYVGLEGLLLRMRYFMSGSAQNRLITELLIQAKRFGQLTETNSIILKTTEKDLASQSGMARETISREMKILRQQGLVINAKNTIIIPDLQKLEQVIMLYY